MSGNKHSTYAGVNTFAITTDDKMTIVVTGGRVVDVRWPAGMFADRRSTRTRTFARLAGEENPSLSGAMSKEIP